MLTLQTRKAAYDLGETVVIALIWKNKTDRTQELTFTTAQRFEVQVERDEKVVWQWRHGQTFPQWGTTLYVEPGESRCFKAEWSQKDMRGQPVPAGIYRIKAWLVTEEPQAAEAIAEQELKVKAQRAIWAETVEREKQEQSCE